MVIPEGVELTVLQNTADIEEVVGARQPPEHPGLFEALSDDGFATRLNDSRAEEQALSLVFPVTHLVAIVRELVQGFAAQPTLLARAW